MRGVTAKKIRKKVYGTMSQRTREYKMFNSKGTIVNTGLRSVYLTVKDQYKRTKKIEI